MSTLPTVCPSCGTPYERIDTNARCPKCQPKRERSTAAERRADMLRPSREAAGYDYAWRKLSRRARRRQPFCSDCGSPDDLTADHTPEAWRRRDSGLPIRLCDVDVVCRRCNSDRGPARGPDARERFRPELPDDAELLGDDQL